MRTIGFHYGNDRWWERSFMFLGANTNKLGVTLDLSQPEGMALLKQLIGKADAVVENFSPRVLEQFGITWGPFSWRVAQQRCPPVGSGTDRL